MGCEENQLIICLLHTCVRKPFHSQSAISIHEGLKYFEVSKQSSHITNCPNTLTRGNNGLSMKFLEINPMPAKSSKYANTSNPSNFRKQKHLTVQCCMSNVKFKLGTMCLCKNTIYCSGSRRIAWLGTMEHPRRKRELQDQTKNSGERTP
jgi:hypothetical protein